MRRCSSGMSGSRTPSWAAPTRAMAQGEESVKLLHRLNLPQAIQYAQHLENYRSSLGSPAPAAQGGGIFDASVVTINPQPQASNTAGPGLLRMALTASQAAVAFASSGLKTVPVETYRAPAGNNARTATCSRVTLPCLRLHPRRQSEAPPRGLPGREMAPLTDPPAPFACFREPDGE